MAEDRHKIAFLLFWGFYKYNVMPLGLTNTPVAFQRLMYRIFHEFLDKFLGVYIDDLLVYSKSLEEHMQYLRLMLN